MGKSRFVALFSARSDGQRDNSENCLSRSSCSSIGAQSVLSHLVLQSLEVTASFAVPHIAPSVRERPRPSPRRGKIEKDASVSQIHLCATCSPRENVRLDRGEL